MKLGELVVELITKGNTKELKKTLDQLKQAEKETKAQIKLNKDLASATTEEEKALIRENHAQKQQIAATEKVIKKNKERNKTIVDGIKGFTRLIGTISLAVGVLDRFANASAKTNQNVLTMAQVSGVDANVINKYTSAARSVNYNVSRDEVAQAFKTISNMLEERKMGMETSIPEATAILGSLGGASEESLRGLHEIETSPERFFERLSRAIRSANDVSGARALEALGLGANLLPLFKMSPEQFKNVPNRYMSKAEMLEEQRLSLELQEKRDELSKAWERALIQLYPTLNNLIEILVQSAPSIVEFLKALMPILNQLTAKLPLLAKVLAEYLDKLTSKIEKRDKNSKKINAAKRAIFAAGFNPSQKDLANAITNSGIMLAPKREYVRNQTYNNTYNNTINTTKNPAEVIDTFGNQRFQNRNAVIQYGNEHK